MESFNSKEENEGAEIEEKERSLATEESCKTGTRHLKRGSLEFVRIV